MFTLLVCFAASEGIKKLWFETSSDNTKEQLYRLQGILFSITLLAVVLYFHLFPHLMYEEEMEVVVRPKDVQLKIDTMRQVRQLLLNPITLAVAIGFSLSSYHSYHLYQSRNLVEPNKYASVGETLATCLVYAPLGFALLVVASVYAWDKINDTVDNVLLQIILLAMVLYSGTFVSLRRLHQVGEYTVNWKKLIIRFGLANLMAFGLVLLCVFIAIANTDFSH